MVLGLLSAVLRLKLMQAEATYTAMSTTLGPNNPALRERLASLQALVQQVENVNAMLRAAARVSVRQTSNDAVQLAAAARQERLRLEADAKAQQRLTLVQLDLAINLTLLGDLQEKLRSAPTQAMLKGLTVHIIDPAVVPVERSHQLAIGEAEIGGIVGLVLGFSLALAMHLLNLKRWTVREVEDAAETPVLALIPGERPGAKGHRDVWGALEIVCDGLPLMRTNQSNVVALFTATHPGEGTTSVVCELGRLLARRGERILVVDANFYHPGWRHTSNLGQERASLPSSPERGRSRGPFSVFPSAASTARCLMFWPVARVSCVRRWHSKQMRWSRC